MNPFQSERTLGAAAGPDSSAGREWLEVGFSADHRADSATTRSRVLVVIPAYNEADSLPAVVDDIRAQIVDADILVIDDGSDDNTRDVLRYLGARWVRLNQRLGLGGAIRTGLRYALEHGYEVVVRLDGDGQHPAALIEPLLAPLARGTADVVIGSRYADVRRPASTAFIRRLLHYGLGRVLSLVTGRLVTDPTSGFWAFGPEAIELLAERHPSGYPEPELVLMLSQTRLRVVEIPVHMRERLAGQSSLTLHRTLNAFAHLLLHLLVVPFRSVPTRRR